MNEIILPSPAVADHAATTTGLHSERRLHAIAGELRQFACFLGVLGMVLLPHRRRSALEPEIMFW